VPELRSRVDRLLDELDETMPDAGSMVAAHGDFHARQLLDLGEQLAIIDFDRIGLAPPASDLAGYAAHLIFGDPRDVERARAALEALVEGYGSAPPDLSWHLATAVLTRASRPFRRFEPSWPERVEAIVGAAETVRAG
jgi:aminoglycoside phosphotransferase (APT) family kinase protein